MNAQSRACRHRWAACVVLVLCVLLPARAHADETALTRSATAARSLDRPHTMAEVGIGFLTLPGADVCFRLLPCTKGTSSIQIDIWQMYRANRDFAIGAGASFALRPTTDNFRGDKGGFQRSHTRSYFLVEAQARYYVLHLDWIEAWLGATAGGVIVSDRYTIEGGDASSAPVLGPRASTVRTEGATIGTLLGTSWTFAQNWSVGGAIRYSRWFLPHEPAQTVFGDTATLTDGQNVLSVELAVNYRIAL